MKPLSIDNINAGFSESYYMGSKGSFNCSLAVDPDYPIPGQTKSSGAIMPIGYSKFSGAGLTGYPKWILTNPKNNKTYVYSTTNFLSYDSALAVETVLSTPTSGAGNGAVYYNDYIYLATPTDISRYGSLAGTPSLTNNVWTGATLGTKTALANTTYPSLSGTPIPNHPMFAHADGSVYVGDVVGGQGVLHRIVTDSAGVNDGSAYNVVDLSVYGYYPTCICNIGKDLVIGCIQTSSDTTISQGEAALLVWETTNVNTFYEIVYLGDPLVTAIKNINGSVYVWSGSATGGYRVRKYLGGQYFQDVCAIEDGAPPFQGAVDSARGKIYWGSNTTYPKDTASVFSYGSTGKISMGLHNVAISTATGANKRVTALKVVEQNGGLVMGVGSDTEKQLEKYSATAPLGSVFRTMVFPVNRKFEVKKIRLSLGAGVTADSTIVTKVFVDDGSDSETLDDGSASETLKEINATNYANNERIIELSSTKIGNNNFFIEFTWSGTAPLPILLPIQVEFNIR